RQSNPRSGCLMPRGRRKSQSSLSPAARRMQSFGLPPPTTSSRSGASAGVRSPSAPLPPAGTTQRRATSAASARRSPQRATPSSPTSATNGAILTQIPLTSPRARTRSASSKFQTRSISFLKMCRRARGMRVVAMLLLVCVASQHAIAWGQEGHSIIAEIAQRRLSATAAAAITSILNPDPSAARYATPTLASIATWAAEVRYNGAQKNETYNWHFVDIPRLDTRYDPATECPKEHPELGDCVINELARLRHELRCTSGEQQLRALKFAVHFVGDIHQPFHTIWEKNGGNGISVKLAFTGTTCSNQ